MVRLRKLAASICCVRLGATWSPSSASRRWRRRAPRACRWSCPTTLVDEMHPSDWSLSRNRASSIGRISWWRSANNREAGVQHDIEDREDDRRERRHGGQSSARVAFLEERASRAGAAVRLAPGQAPTDLDPASEPRRSTSRLDLEPSLKLTAAAGVLRGRRRAAQLGADLIVGPSVRGEMGAPERADTSATDDGDVGGAPRRTGRPVR